MKHYLLLVIIATFQIAAFAQTEEIEITSPCSCQSEAVNGRYYFNETIRVKDIGGLPSGQIWTVTSTTGIDSASLSLNTVLTYHVADQVYKLAPFQHENKMGYTIQIEGPNAVGTPGNVILTKSNNCSFPGIDVVGANEGDIVTSARITWSPSEIPSTINYITCAYTRNGGAGNAYPQNTLINQPGAYVFTFQISGSDDGNLGISPDGGITSVFPTCGYNYKRNFRVNAPPVAICKDIDVTIETGQDTIILAEFINNASTDADNNIGFYQIAGSSGSYNSSINLTATQYSWVTVTLKVIDSLGASSTCLSRITFHIDDCPNDTNKVAPGTCGCGVEDVSLDGDTIADCIDNCPSMANNNQLDADNDGRGDVCDFDPEVVVVLPDTTVFESFGVLKFDLAAVFTDDNNDVLVYNASSSNNAVASVSVVGDTLFINEVSIGSTTITISANDGNNGEVSDDFMVTIDQSVNINNFYTKNIRLIPNPVVDVVTFTNLPLGYNTGLVYNSIGVEVMSVDINSKKIDLSGLSTGLYFLQLSNGKDVVSFKLIKK